MDEIEDLGGGGGMGGGMGGGQSEADKKAEMIRKRKAALPPTPYVLRP